MKALILSRSFWPGIFSTPGLTPTAWGTLIFHSKGKVFRCTASGCHTSFGDFNPGGATDFNPLLNLSGPEKPGPPPVAGFSGDSDSLLLKIVHDPKLMAHDNIIVTTIFAGWGWMQEFYFYLPSRVFSGTSYPWRYLRKSFGF